MSDTVPTLTTDESSSLDRMSDLSLISTPKTTWEWELPEPSDISEVPRMEDLLITFVDSPAAISDLVDLLVEWEGSPLSLAVDVRGVNLGQHGSISIITLMVPPIEGRWHVYLIDVYNLYDLAFTTQGKTGWTLRDVLESPTITKIFWIVQEASDALYANFSIELQGVEDAQMMHYIHRLSRYIWEERRYEYPVWLPQLTAIEDSGWDDEDEVIYRCSTDLDGQHLLNPCDGECNDEFFNERPLYRPILDYCVVQVQYLPALRDWCWGRLRSAEKEKVARDTNKELQNFASDYQTEGRGRGYHMVIEDYLPHDEDNREAGPLEDNGFIVETG